MAYIPDSRNNDDDIFKYNKSDFSFWLLTSLIFYRLWIAQFQYSTLVYLTILEIIVVLCIYLHLISCKRSYMNQKNKRLKTVKEKKSEEITNKLSN